MKKVSDKIKMAAKAYADVPSIDFEVTRFTRGDPYRKSRIEYPSAASLREIPPLAAGAKWSPNPFAERIAKEGIRVLVERKKATGSAYVRKRWREMLATADGLLDHVEAGEPGKQDYLFVEATLLVRVSSMGTPRTKQERDEWEAEKWRVECRVGRFGCAGCLAMEAKKAFGLN